MKELEDVLNRLACVLTSSGQVEATQDLLELRTATVAAGELMAAIDRGDFAAAEFHAELLECQVRESRPVRFRIDGVADNSPL